MDAEKNGLFVTHRLTSDDVTAFLLRLRALAETRLTELDRLKKQFFATSADLDAVSAEELLDLLRRGQVVLLDVRPIEEYEAGHIAGAISIPHDQLKRRISELPKNRKIVAYCRGPYCVFAGNAVKLLRSRGFRAMRIEDGVPDWRARGLPIENRSAGGVGMISLPSSPFDIGCESPCRAR